MTTPPTEPTYDELVLRSLTQDDMLWIQAAIDWLTNKRPSGLALYSASVEICRGTYDNKSIATIWWDSETAEWRVYIPTARLEVI